MIQSSYLTVLDFLKEYPYSLSNDIGWKVRDTTINYIYYWKDTLRSNLSFYSTQGENLKIVKIEYDKK